MSSCGTFRSSCCRRGPARKPVWRASMPGPTIIWSSRSAPANCWRGWARISTWPGCGVKSLKLEQELRAEAQQARERSEAILASINEGFFALDRDWRFTYVDPAAERMLNQPAEALIGVRIGSIYPSARGFAAGSKVSRSDGKSRQPSLSRIITNHGAAGSISVSIPRAMAAYRYISRISRTRRQPRNRCSA